MHRLLLVLSIGTFLHGATSQAAPNLLYILADDLGCGDIGCYGSKDIPTPHLDRLASAGARLTSWYAQPVCTPSRYALLTGRHPNRTAGGLMNALMRADDVDSDKGLRPGETTLASLLRGTGYRTALIGKWHLGHGRAGLLPTHHGFDHFFGHTGGCVDFFTLRYGNIPDWYRGEHLSGTTGYATDVVTDEAVKFLRSQTPERPFFLYLAYAAPHYAKGWDEAGQKLTDVMQAKPETIARMSAITDLNRRVFAAMVVELDEAVGRVLAALDASGHTDDTWVVFASDNGGDLDFGGSNTPLRGEKNTLWEGGVRVPCLMRWPGKIKAGTTVSQPLTVQDMLPSFLCRCWRQDSRTRPRRHRHARSALPNRRVATRCLFSPRKRRIPAPRRLEIPAHRRARDAFQPR